MGGWTLSASGWEKDRKTEGVKKSHGPSRAVKAARGAAGLQTVRKHRVPPRTTATRLNSHDVATIFTDTSLSSRPLFYNIPLIDSTGIFTCQCYTLSRLEMRRQRLGFSSKLRRRSFTHHVACVSLTKQRLKLDKQEAASVWLQAVPSLCVTWKKTNKSTSTLYFILYTPLHLF